VSARIRINWNALNAMLKSPEVAEIVKAETRRVDENVSSQGGQSRVDFAIEGERARGAVIAGYEDGATAESTRSQLLRSLDG